VPGASLLANPPLCWTFRHRGAVPFCTFRSGAGSTFQALMAASRTQDIPAHRSRFRYGSVSRSLSRAALLVKGGAFWRSPEASEDGMP